MAALLAASTVISALPAEAQIRYREPAEFPPAGFSGSQFVDSRGCVFVRAGIAGATSWVPRVTASRQNLCGAQPTFGDGASAQTVIAPQGNAPSGAVVITAPPVAADTAQAQVQPQARPAAPARPAAQQPAAQQPSTAAPTVATPPAQRPRVAAAPAQPVARVNARQAPQAPMAVSRPGAPMRTVASITTPPTIGLAAQQTARANQQTRPGSAAPVINLERCGAGMRCGPQTQDPVTHLTRGVAPSAPSSVPNSVPVRVRGSDDARRPAPGTVVRADELDSLHPDVRVVPRHVAQAQADAASVGPIPEGYRPVWRDDRLNPRRAHGTVAGYTATDLIWTDTVPRRLIERRTGRDVTAANPNLVYPYTDLAAQVRKPVLTQDHARIATSGRTAPQPEARPRAAAAPQAATATVSTRATPAAPARAVSGRFVQVGAFADQANAARTVQRLQAAGLPVVVQRSTSRGKPVQVIMAGPFETGAALSQGLDRSRAAGFRDAFARN